MVFNVGRINGRALGTCFARECTKARLRHEPRNLPCSHVEAVIWRDSSPKNQFRVFIEVLKLSGNALSKRQIRKALQNEKFAQTQ